MFSTVIKSEVAGICNSRNVSGYAGCRRCIASVYQPHDNSVDDTLAVVRSKIHRRLITVNLSCYLQTAGNYNSHWRSAQDRISVPSPPVPAPFTSTRTHSRTLCDPSPPVSVPVSFHPHPDCLHMVQLMPMHPRTPSSLASFKFILVLSFRSQLMQVVLEKRPLNGRYLQK